MIAQYVEVEGRRARVFVESEQPLPRSELDAAACRAVEDDDRGRIEPLRRILGRPAVRGAAHPGVDPTDVRHVYLEGDSGPIFACVVVSEDRLRSMLQEAGTVVEGFSLQVAPGRHLTGDALRAALEGWASRNFADLPTPSFEIDPWIEPQDAAGALAVGAAPLPASDEEFPKTWSPREVVPENAYQDPT